MKHEPRSRTSSRRPAALALLLALAGGAAAAQRAPSDAVLRDFEPVGDWVLAVGGKPVPAAQIYQSETARAFLLMSSAFPSPVLLMAGEGTVSTVHIMKVAKQPDGSIDLLADAILEPQGRLQAAGAEVRFTVGGKPAALQEKPPLLGLRNAAALKSHSPSYVRGAQSYQPNGQQIAALKRNGRPVKVQVFFGTWCAFCKQYVPHVLKVEEALKGSQVQFEYFGLARDMKAPEAKRRNVTGVPTGIVYINGKEVGRIAGDGWKNPEAALAKIISGA